MDDSIEKYGGGNKSIFLDVCNLIKGVYFGLINFPLIFGLFVEVQRLLISPFVFVFIKPRCLGF